MLDSLALKFALRDSNATMHLYVGCAGLHELCIKPRFRRPRAAGFTGHGRVDPVVAGSNPVSLDDVKLSPVRSCGSLRGFFAGRGNK